MDALDELAVGDFFLNERTVAQTHGLEPASADIQVPVVDAHPQRIGVGSGNLYDGNHPAAVLVDENVGVGLERAELGPKYEVHSLLRLPKLALGCAGC